MSFSVDSCGCRTGNSAPETENSSCSETQGLEINPIVESLVKNQVKII